MIKQGNLASIHEVAFRGARAAPRLWKSRTSAVSLHCCQSSLPWGSHSTPAVSHQVCVDHYSACVDIAYACLCCVCAMICVRVCRCVQVCRCVLDPQRYFIPGIYVYILEYIFCSDLLLLPYHVVCITPCLSNSTMWQPRYNGSRTASLCGPLLACVDIAYACV